MENFLYINPFSLPEGDQHLNSLYDSHALSTRQVRKIKKNNTKFSEKVNIEIYGNWLGELAFRFRE